MAAKCPSRGAAGTPRFGRRGEAPPSLSERWSNAWCSQVKVVRSNVNARSCVYACGLRSSAGTSWFRFAQRGATVNATRLRTHGLKSGACDRPETERQSLSPRPSHDSVRRSESSLHTVGPPVLLNSIIGTPGGRYMRLVTPLRAPFAAPIAPSHRGGLIQQPSSATAVHSVPARDLEIQPAFASPVADAKETLAPPLSRVGPLPMPMVVGRHECVIKIRCSLPPH